MSSLAKVKLSASTDGKAIKVAATATAGTLIHTADATALDEIWLWAYNSDTVLRTLTIEFGGATAPDNNIVVDVPPKSGLLLVVPGLILTNSLTVRAFCPTTNVLTLSGYVNRIVN